MYIYIYIYTKITDNSVKTQLSLHSPGLAGDAFQVCTMVTILFYLFEVD